jgi:uncharacterized protein (UPF0276 family)
MTTSLLSGRTQGAGHASPGLGVGLVWWPALDLLCRPEEGLVDVIEAEPEAFWTSAADGSRHSDLAGALAHLPQPKLLHGVGAPLGGTWQAPAAQLGTLRRDIAALRPAHVSEHLSFSHFHPRQSAAPVFANVMLPPLQGAAGVALAAANIVRHRAALGGARLAVETPVSYLPPTPGEWPDGAFMAAVAQAADCGIVLDLNNILCNARNGRQSAEDFLAALPLDRVWELHLGGVETLGGFHLDAHAGPPDDAQFALAADLVPRLPALAAIVFEIMPDRVTPATLRGTAATLGRLQDIWRTRGRDLAPPPVAQHAGEPDCDPATWEALLGSAATGAPEPPLPAALRAWWAECVPERALYRRLAQEARASAIAAAAPHTTRAMLGYYGPQGARRILAAFWRACPACAMAIDEARAFLDFLNVHTTMPIAMAHAVAKDSLCIDTASG